ncbi:hypothetical protein SNEBB_010305 [Seison nebaliae]|nr:hypothetical protein SNEBB_010305 [Seison nebaliae]
MNYEDDDRNRNKMKKSEMELLQLLDNTDNQNKFKVNLKKLRFERKLLEADKVDTEKAKSEYKCEKCLETFNSMVSYRHHMNEHKVEEDEEEFLSSKNKIRIQRTTDKYSTYSNYFEVFENK